MLSRRGIPDTLWQRTVLSYPFVARLSADELQTLRRLTTLFLSEKEFTGAQGMEVDDDVAVAVAVQACLPILNLGLARYAGFKGIVIHADEVVARRVEVDDDGVVHEYAEPLTGEAMQGGPVMLAWSDVADAGETAAWAYNVVIHEFAHVLDLHSHAAQTHLATPALRLAHETWLQALKLEYAEFCKSVEQDFDTLIDPYGAESVEEFFAVASEAFFVQPVDLKREQPSLYDLLRGYYLQDPAA